MSDSRPICSTNDRYLESDLSKIGLRLSNPAVATGRNYPDALAGAALCGSKSSIMMLASPSNTSAISALSGAEGAYIFGGTGAVPTAVESIVNNTLGN